ncbi:Calmodulin [Mizuhopecten yessoensis]|uniref:Calmodulin n=2 Tax=Mizuhopecten yessoensis TaxID=6573 RepID=A0A210R5W3_MIZYE|nr:Calmodulin [Mizuhopecten yessoensis]
MHLNKKELKEQVDKVMADGDKDKNGTIDFDEFLVFMEARMAHHEGTLKEMRDAFRMFDCDSNGFIEADELKSVMLKLGNDLSTKEVEAMIKDADLDGNGKIDFDEFVKYMMEKE